MTIISPQRIAALCVAAALAGAGAAWAVQGWRYGAKLSEVKAQRAEETAKEAGKAVDQLVRAADRVASAASGAQADNTATVRELRAIRQEFKNAKPLPPDCRPDADRLRKRNAAIEAYNRAAAGPVSSGPVQND